MGNYNLNNEADIWIEKVRRTLGQTFAKKILRKASGIAVRAMKREIINNAEYKDIMQPSRNPNKRYKNGNVVASYPIGNLAASIGAFTFKNSPDYFVGPRSKKYKGGKGGGKVDGYYGNIVNNGAKHMKGIHFIEKTKEKTEHQVKEKIKTEAMKELSFMKRKNGIA